MAWGHLVSEIVQDRCRGFCSFYTDLPVDILRRACFGVRDHGQRQERTRDHQAAKQ